MVSLRCSRPFLTLSPGGGATQTSFSSTINPSKTAPAFLRALRTHRRMRERAVLERIRAGDRHIADMVKAIYRDTDPRLHGAAGLSVLAHIEDLLEKGLIVTEGYPSLAAAYDLVR